MYKSTLNALMALGAVVSAFVIWNADADTAGARHATTFDAAPVYAASSARPKSTRRRKLVRKPVRIVRTQQRLRKAKRLRAAKPAAVVRKKFSFKGVNTAPKDAEYEPLGPEWMAGVCETAGGGASTNPDGSTSCVDPDGNDALDPTPAPD